MTSDQFATMIGTMIGVGAVLVAVVKLIIGREISSALKEMQQKLNGLPHRVEDLERRQEYDEKWRHDELSPLIAGIQERVITTQGDVKRLENMIHIDQRLDRIERSITK